MKRPARIYLTIFALLSVLSMSSQAQELTPAHQDSLQNTVEQYFELNLKVYQAGSTLQDIDNLFALFAEDMVYVHPKYGGTYSRQDIYEGYINNQANGGYDGTTVDVKIKNIIIGLNGVATDRVYYKKAADGSLTEVDPGMTVFKFKNGKISEIAEYW